MPVTIVSAGKFRRAVKTSESTDSKKIADKTSIDVSKSDHDTDDDISSQVKALLKRGKNKKVPVKEGCELITRLKQLIADKEKLASSPSPPKSKRRKVDDLPSPPYFPQEETDYSEVDYREFSDEEKELQACQADSVITISDKNTVVKSNAPSDSKDDQKVAKRNASDEEEIITNYIDESIAPSEPKNHGIVLRDFEVGRKRFLPKRNEIQSQKGYTDRNCKTPLYSTGLITRDRYEEIRSKVDVDSTSSDWTERIDDYLISSFHYLRHMTATRSSRPRASTASVAALAASWNAFIVRINADGIEGIIARVQTLEYAVPSEERKRLAQEKRNISSSSTKRIRKDVPSRKSRRDRERLRSIDRAESRSLDRMGIRSIERDSVAHGDRVSSSRTRRTLLGSDRRSSPRDKVSHPSSQLSGVDERAEFESYLREIKTCCSENRDVCADRRIAIYNRLRKLESYPEEISSRVKDLEESLELVQKRLTAQTELYDDLKESYDLLYHRHEVKTVKTLKELMGHVNRLNKRFDLPLPRSPILTPVQQDFVDKSQSYLDDPSPIALEEGAKPPADPPLEKSDTS